MSRNKVIRYMIYKPDYSRRTEHADGTLVRWRNFEHARTMKRARRYARQMGRGATIQQVYRKPSGKRRVRQWVYQGEEG